MRKLLPEYLDWLTGHGVRFDVAADVVEEPDQDGPLLAGEGPTLHVELEGIRAFCEHRDQALGLGADHATGSVARALLPIMQPGWRVWDIGCGTGVLAAVAALAGASSVIGTDVDPRMIALARRTIADAGVDVTLLEGSLLEPVPAQETADLVLANLPHKPGSNGLPIAQAGGGDGVEVHFPFIDQLAPRLAPGTPVIFFLHSLPHPGLLLRYQEFFSLKLLRWKRRYLRVGEYGHLEDVFMERTRAGKSYVVERDGRRLLVACVWKAVRR